VKKLSSSVGPILCIGEYSLVALQYRRIRYIGLRVSADTDAPAAYFYVTKSKAFTHSRAAQRQAL